MDIEIPHPQFLRTRIRFEESQAEEMGGPLAIHDCQPNVANDLDWAEDELVQIVRTDPYATPGVSRARANGGRDAAAPRAAAVVTMNFRRVVAMSGKEGRPGAKD